METIIETERLNLDLYENLIKLTNHVLQKETPPKEDSPDDPMYIGPIIKNVDDSEALYKTTFHFYMKDVQFKESMNVDQFHKKLDCSICIQHHRKNCTLEIFFRLGSKVYMQFFFRSFDTENSTFSYNDRHEVLTIFYNWLHVYTKTFSYPIAITELLRLRGAFEEEKDGHPTDLKINEILCAKD